MNVEEFGRSLVKILSLKSEREERLLTLAKALANGFGVNEKEVAVLRYNSSDSQLSFVWPPKLGKIGAVPLTAHNALCARTLRDRKPYLDNQFSGTKHVSFFEAVRLEPTGESGAVAELPIQKIMSVPLIDGSRLLGVIQLSRKGAQAAEAGADFTRGQLDALAAIATAVAPSLLLED
ncbi:MAG: hypothetical protein C0622_14915 [Desulfuromonas sp.]|nr:MAG: hypothetical protein C0622_14915 [Desulfuromonas sp.]